MVSHDKKIKPKLSLEMLRIQKAGQELLTEEAVNEELNLISAALDASESTTN